MDSCTLTHYVVTVDTPKGVFDVELASTTGAQGAARRAHWSMVAARYGDVDEVRVIGVVELEG